MSDLGRVNQRTATRHEAGNRTRTLRRADKSSRFDSSGRELGKRDNRGRPYEPCVMCSKRAMVRGKVAGVTTWKCSACGYMDDVNGPLN